MQGTNAASGGNEPRYVSTARGAALTQRPVPGGANGAVPAPAGTPAHGIDHGVDEVATEVEDDSCSASDAAAAWARIQLELQRHMQREQYDTWFRRAEPRTFDGATLVMAVQNGFTRYFVSTFYQELLERSVASAMGPAVTVDFHVDAELVSAPAGGRATDAAPPSTGTPSNGTPSNGTPSNGTPSNGTPSNGTPSNGAPSNGAPRPVASGNGGPDPDPAPRESARVAARGSAAVDRALEDTGRALGAGGAPRPQGLLANSDLGLNPSYRFDTFVVGPCNRFAQAAAMGVSETPGAAYNPFFVHGEVGLGKTHLMQSVCRSLIERDPSVRILYLSCETFVNHFIGALENGDLARFRNKYRYVDVLVVDDIHLLGNKERTQEEFFHTFNTLYNAGKQIVLSSDSPPKDIPALQGRLVSRFKWGLVTELEPPCYETRMAILARKARERGRELPDDVASLLAERIESNIRELEGAVTKLIGYSAITRQPISVESTRECLRELFAARRGQPTMEDVLKVVSDHFGVRAADLQSRRRTQHIASSRQVGMFLARKVTRLSLEEIGGFFGGRDHSTVLYAIQKIERLCGSDSGFQGTVVELLTQLRPHRD